MCMSNNDGCSSERNCPQCGHANRPIAKFCARCGARLPEVSPPTAEPPSGATATDVEQLKEARSFWQLLKSILTVGGRAAYAELFQPEPAVKGVVNAATAGAEVRLHFESASVIALVALLLGASLMFAPRAGMASILLLIITGLLLILSWMGVRKPYFTRLSWDALMAVLSKDAPKTAPQYVLNVADESGRAVEVTIIGAWSGELPNAGDRVHIWGIYEDDQRTKIRAWKVQVIDANGQPAGEPLIAPRLYPLVPVL
ncbi:MAG TPA: zinc ribbon domain-containing protein, partial [Armatimonadetes bacterium]|nr:zinc ribbon domain-containing protein [Armatimonadota bacterium]